MSTAAHGGLRAVLDTNVYISAFTKSKGQTFLIWDAACDQLYRLLVSPAIVREMASVLRERFAWSESDVIAHVRLVSHVAEIVIPTATINIITNDPPDNRILECAIDGKADLIVSGDRHLRGLKTYQGIPIIRSTDFLRTLGVSLKK
jgi:uncharacterized protein